MPRTNSQRYHLYRVFRCGCLGKTGVIRDFGEMIALLKRHKEPVDSIWFLRSALNALEKILLDRDAGLVEFGPDFALSREAVRKLRANCTATKRNPMGCKVAVVPAVGVRRSDGAALCDRIDQWLERLK